MSLLRKLHPPRRPALLPGDHPQPKGNVSLVKYARSYPEVTLKLLSHDMCVACLPGGRVLEADGIVLTRENQLVADVSPHSYTKPRRHSVFRQRWLPTSRTIQSRVAVIAAPQPVPYRNWMFQILPRLELLRQSGLPYDQLYIPELLWPYQWETLKRIGVNWNQIIIGSPGVHLQADSLLVPSLPMQCTPWISDYLRNLLLPQERLSANRKLYVRSEAADEQQVAEALLQRGFELVQPEFLPVEAQARLFASANCIVSASTAALTNMVFCSPGTQVIEYISAEGRNNGHQNIAHYLHGQVLISL